MQSWKTAFNENIYQDKKKRKKKTDKGIVIIHLSAHLDDEGHQRDQGGRIVNIRQLLVFCFWSILDLDLLSILLAIILKELIEQTRSRTAVTSIS